MLPFSSHRILGPGWNHEPHFAQGDIQNTERVSDLSKSAQLLGDRPGTQTQALAYFKPALSPTGRASILDLFSFVLWTGRDTGIIQRKSSLTANDPHQRVPLSKYIY